MTRRTLVTCALACGAFNLLSPFVYFYLDVAYPRVAGLANPLRNTVVTRLVKEGIEQYSRLSDVPR